MTDKSLSPVVERVDPVPVAVDGREHYRAVENSIDGYLEFLSKLKERFGGDACIYFKYGRDYPGSPWDTSADDTAGAEMGVHWFVASWEEPWDHGVDPEHGPMKGGGCWHVVVYLGEI